MLGQNGSSHKCNRTVNRCDISFVFISMNLPDDDNQWLIHGAVAIRSYSFGDNQGSKKDWVMMSFMVCTHQIFE